MRGRNIKIKSRFWSS